MQKLSVIVMQPTSMCNLNCKYCYIPESARQNSLIMKEEVLEASIKALFASQNLNSSILINWHAGEPLTAGIAFYKKATELIDRYRPNNINVLQSIQTNGILINDKWCEFLKKSKIDISVSLDGPEHIHNTNRRTWQDKGSFPRVMRGIERLKSHDIPFYVLMVVTDACLDYPDELFNFFIDQQIPAFGFNVEEVASSNNVSSMNSFIDVKKRYIFFIERLSELWIQHKPKLKIREFERSTKDILHRLNQGSGAVKSQIESSKGILTIKRNGDIVPFSPEMATGTPNNSDYFVIGNVLDLPSLSHIFETSKFKKMFSSIQKGVENCKKSCDYFSMCGGGCPGNKYYEHQSFESTETQFCIYYYQYILDILLSHFKINEEAVATSKSVN